ncbi:MAG: phospholipid carrier-dependent glycosyltransferase [Candidatus Nanopelagicales bacterium]
MTATAAPPSAVDAPPTGRRFSVTGRWLGPLAVTALGGILRFQELGRPHAFVFDETYYAKDGLSLLTFGYEQGFVDKADKKILAGDGTVDPGWFTGDPSFIVHPPVGKWLIGLGEAAFGATPMGWRLAVAVLGTLTILIVARAVLRLTGSALWGTVAGLLMAIDGMAIVMSRTAVLDGILTFFVVAAFACLLVDRDWARAGRTPGVWWRPWRLLAAVCLGLACGVKWSGIWFVAVFCLMTVLWDVGRRARDTRWWAALLRSGVPTALTMLSIIVVVYVASWAGWFAGADAWDRTWNDAGGVVGSLSSLLHYHSEMWDFHNGLTTDHSYQSSAFGWLVEARPTSFFYEDPGGCDSGQCSQAVTALGNPVIWWSGTLALLYQLWRWLAHRDWRSGAVLAAVVAGWVPWLLFPDRTIFTFYAIVILPFLVMGLTLSLAQFVRPDDRNVRIRVGVVTVFLLACVGVSGFFYPIWSAEVIDYATWSQRMWLPTWV